jgi:TPR repeat protein
MKTSLVKIARDGKTIRECTLADLGRAISDKTILPTDYYWRSGMSGWERVELIAAEAAAALEGERSAREQGYAISGEFKWTHFIKVCGKVVTNNPIVAFVVFALVALMLYSFTSLSAPHSPAVSQSEEQSSGDNSSPDALYQHGLSVNHGRGGYLNSYPYFRKAAEMGHAKAQVKVGVYFQTYPSSIDFSESLKWLTKAAEKKEPEAYFWLGMLYSNERTPFRDAAEACKWFNVGVASHDVNSIEACRKMLDSFRNDPDEYGVSYEQQAVGLRRAQEYAQKSVDR